MTMKKKVKRIQSEPTRIIKQLVMKGEIKKKRKTLVKSG
jgi:hypothetical protein